jgi:DNA topoisomerase IA
MPRNGRMDDKAHPPIYPLKPYPSDDSLDRFVWEYVARRFLANVFTNDAVRVSQNLKIDIEGIIFSASGTYFVDDGFYKVYHYFRPREARLPSAKSGDTAKVLNIWIRKDKTKPPSRLSEADLLAKMEMAGIGTDATRASYPKLIIDRGYAKKVRGRFVPTILGVKLIESLENVDPQLVTPDTRRFVEELMEKIGFGYESIDNALRVSLEKYKKFYLECIDKLDNIKSRFMEAVGGRDSE